MARLMVRLHAPLFGLALLLLPATAEAQYFGRNKVQYEHFDFKVLQTDHFDVYLYPRVLLPQRARGGGDRQPDGRTLVYSPQHCDAAPAAGPPADPLAGFRFN